jgi:hypothetical protein
LLLAAVREPLFIEKKEGKGKRSPTIRSAIADFIGDSSRKARFSEKPPKASGGAGRSGISLRDDDAVSEEVIVDRFKARFANMSSIDQAN